MLSADKTRVTRDINKIPKLKSDELKGFGMEDDRKQSINERYDNLMTKLISQRNEIDNKIKQIKESNSQRLSQPLAVKPVITETAQDRILAAVPERKYGTGFKLIK